MYTNVFPVVVNQFQHKFYMFYYLLECVTGMYATSKLHSFCIIIKNSNFKNDGHYIILVIGALLCSNMCSFDVKSPSK